MMVAPVPVSLNESAQDTRSLGIVAVFESADQAEAAVEALQAAGLDLRRLSIVAKDGCSGEHLLGWASSGRRTRFWGRLAPTWNRLMQRLPGAAFLFVPFAGHLVILGTVADWLTDDQPSHGCAEGATRLWRLLARVGVPSRDGIALESALREFDFMLVTVGAREDIQRARRLLRIAARRAAA